MEASWRPTPTYTFICRLHRNYSHMWFVWLAHITGIFWHLFGSKSELYSWMFLMQLRTAALVSLVMGEGAHVTALSWTTQQSSVTIHTRPQNTLSYACYPLEAPTGVTSALTWNKNVWSQGANESMSTPIWPNSHFSSFSPSFCIYVV